MIVYTAMMTFVGDHIVVVDREPDDLEETEKSDEDE